MVIRKKDYKKLETLVRHFDSTGSARAGRALDIMVRNLLWRDDTNLEALYQILCIPLDQLESDSEIKRAA